MSQKIPWYVTIIVHHIASADLRGYIPSQNVKQKLKLCNIFSERREEK